MPLTEYADIVAQNLGWLITIGVAVCLFFFFTFTVNRRLFHVQKELVQLSEDVAALRLAEERRFFTGLRPYNRDHLTIALGADTRPCQ
jgi:hypothetical protein